MHPYLYSPVHAAAVPTILQNDVYDQGHTFRGVMMQLPKKVICCPLPEKNPVHGTS